DGLLAHLLRHVLPVAARLRAMSHTTTDEDRCVAAAVTRTARALLTVPLGLGPVDLAARLRGVGAEPGVRHLANVSLVHQANINGPLKDAGRQFLLAHT